MKIKETNKKIQKEIQKIFLRQLYGKLREVSDKIQNEIRQETLRVWKSTATYDSLLNGQLNHEFGFPKGEAESRVNAILEVLSRSILVVPKLPNRRSPGGGLKTLEIRVFTKAVAGGTFLLPEAIIETEKKAENDISDDFGDFGAKAVRKQLHWLSWLLTKGNQYIIFNYEYVDVVSPRSRSGRGLMVYDENQDWKVPAEFSGTRESNWLIRSLQEDAQLPSKYAEIINKHISGVI